MSDDRDARESFAGPWYDEDSDAVAPLRRPARDRLPVPEEEPTPAWEATGDAPAQARHASDDARTSAQANGLPRPETSPPRRRPRYDRTPAPHQAPVRRRLLRAIPLIAIAAILVVGLIVSLRGVVGGDSGGDSAGAPGITRGWPDDEARAFASQAARAFLTFTPAHPDYHRLAVKPFLANRLRGALALPDRGLTQTVSAITIARVRPAGPDRALLTVAATVLNRTVTTRYLTVPVARDHKGGLIVYDYPAFSGPPPRARIAGDQLSALKGPSSAAITRLAHRFLTAYLGGEDQVELLRFLAPDSRITPLTQRYELHKVLDVSQLGSGGVAQRRVAVAVRARDAQTRAEYVLRYRLELVLRGTRWLVRSLDVAPSG